MTISLIHEAKKLAVWQCPAPAVGTQLRIDKDVYRVDRVVQTAEDKAEVYVIKIVKMGDA